MIQDGHLQVFDLILETRSPVFIGSGKQYIKKEYLFDPKSNVVSFLDERKFFTCLAEHGLADAYEQFILKERDSNLLNFLLNTCRLSRGEVDSLVRCRIYAGDALDQNHTLKEIHRFIRNGNDQVYVPGSSIKGALRTALVKAMLLQSPSRKPSPGFPADAVASLEVDLFHTLSLKRDRNQNVEVRNSLNSVLQGVRISDSLPIPNRQLCLAGKTDEFVDGTYNRLNLCRECIRPGTRIVCTMTLDQSVLKGQITKESILKAIADVSRFYQETVLSHYPHAANVLTPGTILLGGGVGFQSKTVLAPYYEDSLAKTTAVLQKAFPRHFHEEDALDGISPRALKQTAVDGVDYPYGVCEVILR